MKLSLFYQQITVLDYAYLDHHRGLVGDSALVDMELIGSTDAEGILYDFSRFKQQVKQIIDQECDHRLLVPRGTALAQVELGGLELHFNYGSQQGNLLYYRAPTSAFCQLPTTVVTRSKIADYLESLVMPYLPANILAVNFVLHAPDGASSGEQYFHYTHGLKHHYGNCQRLFHGHRNTIQVLKNGEIDRPLEAHLARHLFAGNIHFVHWENVTNQMEIIGELAVEQPVGRYECLGPVQIAYQGCQGEFEARLPGREVYFLPVESTVENLAQHFLSILRPLVAPADHLLVRAYEGLGKGAIAAL